MPARSPWTAARARMKQDGSMSCDPPATQCVNRHRLEAFQVVLETPASPQCNPAEKMKYLRTLGVLRHARLGSDVGAMRRSAASLLPLHLAYVKVEKRQLPASLVSQRRK